MWPPKFTNDPQILHLGWHCDPLEKISRENPAETVKWLDYYRYSQLTRWCSGNASALDARGPGFNPRLRQGFLCLIFCIVVVVFLLFCPKNTLFIGIYCNSFYNVNLFSILNVLQDLWPIIRVKDTDLASLNKFYEI